MCLASGALNIVIMIALVTVRLADNHYHCHMSNKFMSDSRMWAWMHRILNRKLKAGANCISIFTVERQKFRLFEKEGVPCRQLVDLGVYPWRRMRA